MYFKSTAVFVLGTTPARVTLLSGGGVVRPEILFIKMLLPQR